MRRLERGGLYLRVCDPTWADPSDTAYAKKFGGRWNPAGEFGALYLCATLDVARANAHRHVADLFGDAVSIFDIEEAARPELQQYDVTTSDVADVVTSEGIDEAELPASFPNAVPHAACHPFAREAYALTDLHGIAPLSAVFPTQEELVVFDRSVDRAKKTDRLTFTMWFIA